MAMQSRIVTGKNAANFDIGAGEFSFRNFDKDTNPNNVFISLGNCSAVTSTWETNKIQKYDATRGTKELLAEVETQRKLGLAITMDESDPIKYALAMYGETTVINIPETEITDQVFTVSPGDAIFILLDDKSTAAYNYEDLKVQYVNSIASNIGAPALNRQGGIQPPTGSIGVSGTYTGNTMDDIYIKISTANSVPQTITDTEFTWKKGLAGTYSAPITVTGAAQVLTEGVSVTFAAGATGQDFELNDEWKIRVTPTVTDLIQGIDYNMDDVDVRNGKVRFNVDSAMPFNSIIKVSCKVPKQAFPRIYAGVKKKIEGELRFEYDPMHGRQQAWTFYKVSISPSGDDSKVSDEWGSRQLAVSVLADRTKADPRNPNSVYCRTDYPGDTTGILVQQGE